MSLCYRVSNSKIKQDPHLQETLISCCKAQNCPHIYFRNFHIYLFILYSLHVEFNGFQNFVCIVAVRLRIQHKNLKLELSVQSGAPLVDCGWFHCLGFSHLIHWLLGIPGISFHNYQSLLFYLPFTFALQW